MLKKILKKIIMSFFILYWFNQIGVSLNVVIPINIITLLFIFAFNIPGVAVLIFSLFLIF